MRPMSENARNSAAEQAALHSTRSTRSLAAKLAAARRNGVICLIDNGDEYWFAQPGSRNAAFIDGASNDLDASHGTHRVAAKRPRDGAAARHRPPSYHKRLTQRQEARRQIQHDNPPSATLGTATPQEPPPPPPVLPPQPASSSPLISAVMDDTASGTTILSGAKRRAEDASLPHAPKAPPPPPLPPGLCPPSAAPLTAPLQPRSLTFATPPASPSRSTHGTPSSWADEPDEPTPYVSPHRLGHRPISGGRANLSTSPHLVLAIVLGFCAPTAALQPTTLGTAPVATAFGLAPPSDRTAILNGGPHGLAPRPTSPPSPPAAHSHPTASQMCWYPYPPTGSSNILESTLSYSLSNRPLIADLPSQLKESTASDDCEFDTPCVSRPRNGPTEAALASRPSRALRRPILPLPPSTTASDRTAIPTGGSRGLAPASDHSAIPIGGSRGLVPTPDDPVASTIGGACNTWGLPASVTAARRRSSASRTPTSLDLRMSLSTKLFNLSLHRSVATAHGMLRASLACEARCAALGAVT